MMRAAIVTLCLLLTSTASAATPDVTAKQVDDALAKAKQYLIDHQKNGNWETTPARDPKAYAWDLNGWQWGGATAVATYALLASGDSPNDAHVKPAIDFLEHADIRGIYALGVRDMAMLYVPPNAITRQIAHRDGLLLFQGLNKVGIDRGLYDYYPGDPDHRIDHSSSQFGVLGMWACQRNGFDTPSAYWGAIEKTWASQIMSDGGWCYNPAGTTEGRGDASPAMTAAGIATLFLAHDGANPDAGLECLSSPRNAAIGKGIEWIKSHGDEIFGGQFDHRYYAFYGMERIGVASGLKFFGKHDWYREIAAALIKQQNPDGSWFEEHYGSAYGGALADTCFGILFLSRGRGAIMANKLDFSADEPEKQRSEQDWNLRPRDLSNLSEWTGRQTERELNWQTIGLTDPPTDFDDSEILLIDGHDLPTISDEHIKTLKDFVARGGMILGNAACASKPFVTKFRKLAETMFPDYEFRALPADHPIFTDEQFSTGKWPRKPTVLGLSNGVRELMLLVPDADLTKAWQTRGVGGHEELLQLGANIFEYATDKSEDLTKETSYRVDRDSSAAPKTIKIARLKYAGNWDPEPGGWVQLANSMHNQQHIDLSTVPIELGKGELETSGANIATLTGTDPFKPTAAQQQEIKDFVTRGGTLLIDAAGGSSTFATSVESMLTSIFPNESAPALKSPLPPTSPIFTDNIPIEYRRFARSGLTGSLKQPRLIGFAVGGKRLNVFYSREDLSGGLVGEPVDGVMGYAPASATKIVAGVLMYSQTK